MQTKRESFEITNHCCRACGGRVLLRRGEGGKPEVRCAECGTAATGDVANDKPHRLMCYCGATLMNGVDARLRCQVNKSKSLERPQEVLVGYVPAGEAKKVNQPKAPRAVRSIGGFDGF